MDIHQMECNSQHFSIEEMIGMVAAVGANPVLITRGIEKTCWVSPSLVGWVPLGGDPCLEAWQCVLCVNSNVTGISLSGVNLGGQLVTTLDLFTSIISIDLSANHIGGTIPGNLPPTIKTFLL